MSYVSPNLRAIFAVLATLLVSEFAQADFIIDPGYDLFTMQQGSFIDLGSPSPVLLTGVPLENFDFGSGLTAVGDANRVVYRPEAYVLQPGGAGVTHTSTFLAASFKTEPIDVGFGPIVLYGIQNFTGPSTFDMTLTLDASGTGGTISGSGSRWLEFHIDSPDGPLINSPLLTNFTAVGTWSTTPPANMLQIPGITSNNFFIDELVVTLNAGLGEIVSQTTTTIIPEPSSLVLAAFGGIGMIVVRLRGRKSRVTRTA